MEAYGAKVILTPADKTIEYSRTLAEQMAADDGYFMLNQFANPDNYGAHYRTTGPEICGIPRGRSLTLFRPWAPRELSWEFRAT